ncbi:MAG TPA: response regulator [Kofleriaceae bacterium]|nr:response regulator [Kofleriaceae bacterium]
MTPTSALPKVAVVDDDREVRDALAEALAEAGFDVKVAANGLRLVSTLQVDRPDIILLDVIMSWIDGFELCRALKRNPEFRDIPVVFISGRSHPGDRDFGIACGAVEYFPKPLDMGELIGCLKGLAAP